MLAAFYAAPPAPVNRFPVPGRRAGAMEKPPGAGWRPGAKTPPAYTCGLAPPKT